MHSSTTLAVLLLAASAASPALAAPLSTNQARELDELSAREPSLLSILKPLGTGLLGGGAVAALDHFIGGGDKSGTSKRQNQFTISPEDAARLREAVANGGFATPASRRELAERFI
ncbi:hypothetical protein FA95DRAFT_1610368, partial [Auriscalpium vulgare]